MSGIKQLGCSILVKTLIKSANEVTSPYCIDPNLYIVLKCWSCSANPYQ